MILHYLEIFYCCFDCVYLVGCATVMILVVDAIYVYC